MRQEIKVKDATAEMQVTQRIARGDTRAFEALMRRHNRMLFRAARAILRDDAEAEDALQEAWLRAYRAIGTFRGEAKLSSWLVRIAANEALARRRKAMRGPEMLSLGGEEPDVEPQADARRQASAAQDDDGGINAAIKGAFDMDIGLHRGVAALLAAVLSAALLAGCSEEAQLLIPAGEQTIERQDRDRQLGERALNQGESGRMAY